MFDEKLRIKWVYDGDYCVASGLVQQMHLNARIWLASNEILHSPLLWANLS